VLPKKPVLKHLAAVFKQPHVSLHPRPFFLGDREFRIGLRSARAKLQMNVGIFAEHLSEFQPQMGILNSPRQSHLFLVSFGLSLRFFKSTIALLAVLLSLCSVLPDR